MSDILAQRVAELTQVVEDFKNKSKKINQLDNNVGYEDGMLVAVFSPSLGKAVQYPLPYYELGAYINRSEINIADGVAGLDENGLIYSHLLPSFVDDVLEFDNLAVFPATGESGKIYINKDNNKSYRWSGSLYVPIADDTAIWGAVQGDITAQSDLIALFDNVAYKDVDNNFNNQTFQTVNITGSNNAIWMYDRLGSGDSIRYNLVGTTFTYSYRDIDPFNDYPIMSTRVDTKAVTFYGNLNAENQLKVKTSIGDSYLYGHHLQLGRNATNYVSASQVGGKLSFVVNGDLLSDPALTINTDKSGTFFGNVIAPNFLGNIIGNQFTSSGGSIQIRNNAGQPIAVFTDSQDTSLSGALSVTGTITSNAGFATGLQASNSGAIRLENGDQITSRNSANSGNRTLMYLDGSNILQMAVATNTVFGGSLTASSFLVDAASGWLVKNTLGNHGVYFDGTETIIQTQGVNSIRANGTTVNLRDTYVNGTLNVTSGYVGSEGFSHSLGVNIARFYSASDAPLMVESTDPWTGIQFKDSDNTGILYYRGVLDQFSTSSKFLISNTLNVTGTTTFSQQVLNNNNSNATGSNFKVVTTNKASTLFAYEVDRNGTQYGITVGGGGYFSSINASALPSNVVLTDGVNQVISQRKIFDNGGSGATMIHLRTETAGSSYSPFVKWSNPTYEMSVRMDYLGYFQWHNGTSTAALLSQSGDLSLSGGLTIGSTSHTGQPVAFFKKDDNTSSGWYVGYTNSGDNTFGVYGFENADYRLYTNNELALEILADQRVFFKNSIHIPDYGSNSAALRIGNSSDLVVYHDGSSNYLQSKTGNMYYFMSNDASHVWHVNGIQKMSLNSSTLNLYNDLRFGDGAVRSIIGATNEDLRIIGNVNSASEGVKISATNGVTYGLQVLYNNTTKVFGTLDIEQDGTSGYTHSRIILNSGSNARGTGTYAYGQTSDWFWGNPYQGQADYWMIGKSSSGAGQSTAQLGNAIFYVQSTNSVLRGNNFRVEDIGVNATFHQFETSWNTNISSSIATYRSNVGTWRFWSGIHGGAVFQVDMSTRQTTFNASVTATNFIGNWNGLSSSSFASISGTNTYTGVNTFNNVSAFVNNIELYDNAGASKFGRIYFDEASQQIRIIQRASGVNRQADLYLYESSAYRKSATQYWVENNFVQQGNDHPVSDFDNDAGYLTSATLTDYAKHNDVQNYSKQQYFSWQNLSNSSNTFNWDCDSQQMGYILVSGNFTINNATNIKDGAVYYLKIEHNVAGAKNITFGSGYDGGGLGLPSSISGVINEVTYLMFLGGAQNKMHFMGLRDGYTGTLPV